jgi:hypothetical protein
MVTIVSPRQFANALLIALVALVIVLPAPTAHAQRYRRRLPASVATAIALQPFTLYPSRSVTHTRNVAYYAPHSFPRVERSTSSFEEEDASPASTVSSGSRPVVNGNRAVIRNGVAYAPSNAPDRVKNAIWAVNTIRRKPYVWGGGHGSFNDRGYDCSGTVSYALHHAGLLGSPLPSSDLMRYGERGRGRWFTVYARRGHTFAMIAGLRLDTTDFRYGGDVGPRWHNDNRDTRGFVATHPSGL